MASTGTTAHHRPIVHCRFTEPEMQPDCMNGNGESRTEDWKELRSGLVQVPALAGRRFVSSVSLLPIGKFGKELPSKWEDAEKWIRSPVNVDGVGMLNKPTLLPWRMSKSGPIRSPVNYILSRSSASSPSFPNIDKEACGNHDTDRRVFDQAVRNVGKELNYSRSDHGVRRPSSIYLLSNMSFETTDSSSSLPNITSTVAVVSPSISKEDVAKETSSTFLLSSEDRPQPEALPLDEVHSDMPAVKADESVSVPKVKSALEEKINCWEKLQKAKAEESIRKLEMKLEKETACSMEKISKKLISAQKKAEEMRRKANIKFQCDQHRHCHRRHNKVDSDTKSSIKKSHFGLFNRCGAFRV